jgi:hypothetical protein
LIPWALALQIRILGLANGSIALVMFVMCLFAVKRADAIGDIGKAPALRASTAGLGTEAVL